MYRITSFIFAAIFISVVAALMALFYSGLAAEHNLQDYDNETLESYNKLQDLTKNAEEVKDEVGTIKEKEGILDIIGGFFSSTYQALTTTKASLDVVDSMVDDAAEDSGLGQAGAILKAGLLAALIIAIFVGVIIRLLIKGST